MENGLEKKVNAVIKWPAFTMKAENDKFIILYQHKKLYPLPKSSFKTETELAEFKRFLTEQTFITPKKFGIKQLWGKI